MNIDDSRAKESEGVFRARARAWADSKVLSKHVRLILTDEIPPPPSLSLVLSLSLSACCSSNAEADYYCRARYLPCGGDLSLVLSLSLYVCRFLHLRIYARMCVFRARELSLPGRSSLFCARASESLGGGGERERRRCSAQSLRESEYA